MMQRCGVYARLLLGMHKRDSHSSKDRLYAIDKFSTDRLVTPFPDKVLVAIGKRGSGKSTLMKTVIALVPRFENGMVFSPTEEANGGWSSVFPPTNIHKEFTDALVEQAKVYQMHQKHKTIQRIKRTFGRDPVDEDEIKAYMPGFVLILDDCFYDTSKKNSKALRWLFFNGRHYKFFVVCSLQYLLDLSPGLRSQIDYVFFTKEVNGNVRKKVYNEYFSGLIKRQSEFERILDKHTENRGLLVFSPTGNSNRAEDCVWYFKADPAAKARVGSLPLWAWAKRHYIDPELLMDADLEDASDEEDDGNTVILS